MITVEQDLPIMPPRSGRGSLSPLDGDPATINHSPMPATASAGFSNVMSSYRYVHVIVSIFGVIRPAELDKGKRFNSVSSIHLSDRIRPRQNNSATSRQGKERRHRRRVPRRSAAVSASERMMYARKEIRNPSE